MLKGNPAYAPEFRRQIVELAPSGERRRICRGMHRRLQAVGVTNVAIEPTSLLTNRINVFPICGLKGTGFEHGRRAGLVRNESRTRAGTKARSVCPGHANSEILN